jgi:phosphoglycolate phosphatase
MRKVHTICFDLDGTLVDSSRDIADAVNFTLKRMGRDERPFREIHDLIGTGVRDLIRKSLDDPGDTRLVEKGIDIFSRRFGEHFADHTTIYPNVRKVLERFSDKTLVVTTNRRTVLTEGTLDKFGISGYFDRITGGDDDDCLKPSACPLRKALGGHEGGRGAIMVGDMDVDIEAGKRAGMATCAVTYGIGSRADLERAEPDHMIDDIIQLMEIIR